MFAFHAPTTPSTSRATRTGPLRAAWCALLALLMVIVVAPPAHPAPPEGPGPTPTASPERGAVAAVAFIDVGPDTAFAPEITWLAERGITTGWVTERGREFRPVTPVARDAMAAFFYRLAGSPDFNPPATSPFRDVPTDHPFYREIAWFEAQSITTGWRGEDGTREFRPLDPVSREAMAAFFYRFSGSPAHTPPAASPFSDVPMDHLFYREITWLQQSGITTGWRLPDGTAQFRPSLSVNRDAMAAFMYRHTHLKADVIIRERSFAATKAQCDAIIAYDPATGTIIAARNESFFSDRRVDDAITTHPCPAAPESFLRRVTGIEAGADTVTFTTEPITLGEIIISTGGLLEPSPEVVEETLEPLNGAIITQDPLAPGAGPGIAATPRETTVKWAGSVSASAPLGGAFSGEGTLSIDMAATVGLLPRLSVDKDQLNAWKRIRFSLESYVKPTSSASLTAGLVGEAAPNLLKIRRVTKFAVGAWPVFLTHEATLGADLKLDANTGFEADPLTGEVGLEYGIIVHPDGDWEQVWNRRNTLSGGGLRIAGKPGTLEAEVVAPRLGVRTLAYGLVGGEFKAGMFGNFEGNLDPTDGWSCTLNGGLRTELSGAMIRLPKLFGFLTFDYEPTLNDELILWRNRGRCGEPEIAVKYLGDQNLVRGRNKNTKCTHLLEPPGVNEFQLNARWLKPRTRYDLSLQAGPPLADVKLEPVTSDADGFIDLADVETPDMPAGPWQLVATPEDGPEATTALRLSAGTCLYYLYYEDDSITFESFDGSGTYPNSGVSVTVTGGGFGQGTSDDNGTFQFPVQGSARCGDTVQVTYNATYRFAYEPVPRPLTLTCPEVTTVAGQGAGAVAVPLGPTG